MDQIIIAFNGTPKEEREKVEGVIASVPWDALMPKINDSVRLRPDEYISGLIVNDTDVRVKISRKKGRKVKDNGNL